MDNNLAFHETASSFTPGQSIPHYAATSTALKPALVTLASEWNLRTISFFFDTRLKLFGSLAPHRYTFVYFAILPTNR